MIRLLSSSHPSFLHCLHILEFSLSLPSLLPQYIVEQPRAENVARAGQRRRNFRPSMAADQKLSVHGGQQAAPTGFRLLQAYAQERERGLGEQEGGENEERLRG